MISLLLFICVAILAYANGANDNFKGVASLYGSRTCSHRTALGWATIMTMAGSFAAIFLASVLLKNFSGKGLIPDNLTESVVLVLAIAFGAGSTVLLATRFGFPVSTTHGLTGSLFGAGMVAAGGQVNHAMLGKVFITPLLLSPLLAVVVGALIYLTLKGIRKAAGIGSESCVCIGNEWIPVASSNGEACVSNQLAGTVGTTAECETRYQGSVLGVEVRGVVDQLHFLSAGAVSFARGLNDTPKIAALLLVTGTWSSHWNLVIVAFAIALGGLLSSRRVAHTMSHKITDMGPGQGLAANLSTALLVTTASVHGMPVSTTHVSVGSLLGMGTVSGQAKWKSIFPVLASWVITLPLAAGIAALSYFVLNSLSS